MPDDLDGFTVQPDMYDRTAQLICSRCDAPWGDAIEVDGRRDWQQEALADLVAAARAHTADVHPLTIQLAETQPHSPQECAWAWTEDDREHRCNMPRDLDHHWHRCLCGVLHIAALRTDDVAKPACRACGHAQDGHGLFGCMHRYAAAGTPPLTLLCQCPAAFGGDAARIAAADANPTTRTYTVEEAILLLQLTGKRVPEDL